MGIVQNCCRTIDNMDYMTSHIYDFIVVGSGPAGVMCSQTLVEAGKNVLMIDAGTSTESEDPGWTDNFLEVRQHNNHQSALFLGDKMELLDFDSGKEFGQMTPQRRYVVDNVQSILPVDSKEFELLESLATGGLGNAWGLGCFTFSETELSKAKLHPQKIHKAYDVIARRIGISYTPDDIRSYVAQGVTSLQPSIGIDDNAKAILQRYHQRRKKINEQAFYAGVPALALLTRDKDGRKGTDYNNMDFYYNFGSSAYRPSVTIKHLQSFSNFSHQRGIVVSRFDEHKDFVKVSGIDRSTNQMVQARARKIVLACNVFGTARIVLRSTANFGVRVPVLSNPYSIMATLQWSRLGKVPSPQKTSTVQVCMFHDPGGQHSDVPMASLYSYSSLMLFRLLKKSPLNFRDSLRILIYLHPALVIAGIHHPSSSSGARHAYLRQDDTLVITDNDRMNFHTSAIEKKFSRVLMQLGCIPFKKIERPQGSSAHYAGTLPFSDQPTPLTLSSQGLLAGTRNVYVADASGFHYLPAKGPTLTIMANAHNVAQNIVHDDK
jgi:hypothetical protein